MGGMGGIFGVDAQLHRVSTDCRLHLGAYEPGFVHFICQVCYLRYRESGKVSYYGLSQHHILSACINHRSNSKRAELLRIPLRPDIFYKKEWIDEETFFRKD